MNLNSRCTVLANVRLEIITEMEADLKARYLELMQLRERLREAELFSGSAKDNAGSKARVSRYRRNRLARVAGGEKPSVISTSSQCLPGECKAGLDVAIGRGLAKPRRTP
jgi:hypothetical protein